MSGEQVEKKVGDITNEEEKMEESVNEMEGAGTSQANEEESTEESKEEESKEEESKEEESKEEESKEAEESTSKDDDGDDDSDSEEELPPGLLERPVEIFENKRDRKKCVPFSFDEKSPSPNKKKVEIPEGKGVKLGEHPHVNYQLDKNPSQDLKIIHRLFFGSVPGKGAHGCKTNLRNFCGFAFDEDSIEYRRKEEYLGRFTMANLKWTVTVLDCDKPTGKNKDQLISSILTWCLNPQPSGKPLPTKGAKTPSKKTPKKKAIKRKSEGTGEKTAKKRKSEAGEAKTAAKKKKTDGDKPEKAPKKKGAAAAEKAEKKTAKKEKTPAKKRAAKKEKESPAKKNKTGPKVKITADKPSSSKKSKKMTKPTDTSIREAIEKILEDADLEATTMKNVCTKVYGMFPGHDISDRKTFIKSIVREVINANS